MREQTDTLIDFNEPRFQTKNKRTTDIDEVAFSKLQIRQSDLKEEPTDVTDSLILPPPSMETPGHTAGNINREELLEAEKGFRRKTRNMTYTEEYT